MNEVLEHQHEIHEQRRKYDAMTDSEKLTLLLESVDALAYAFPDGPNKHREAHQAWIDEKTKQAQFYDKLRYALVEKGLIALVGLLCVIFLIGTKDRILHFLGLPS